MAPAAPNGLSRMQIDGCESLAEIIGPLTRSLGPNYEIVLHDYTTPDRSVVAVAGRVTERCINLDVTAIRHAAAALDRLTGHYVEPKPTAFSNDIRDVIDVALREVLGGRTAALLSRQERLDVVRALDARGIFSVKRAINRVAAGLNVSRATAYSCLQIVRAETAETKLATSNAKRAPSLPQ